MRSEVQLLLDEQEKVLHGKDSDKRCHDRNAKLAVIPKAKALIHPSHQTALLQRCRIHDHRHHLHQHPHTRSLQCGADDHQYDQAAHGLFLFFIQQYIQLFQYLFHSFLPRK